MRANQSGRSETSPHELDTIDGWINGYQDESTHLLVAEEAFVS